MFKQFFDVFWPKAVEFVADHALGNILNIKNFKHILETLKENLELLSAQAFDVETVIKNAQLSGRRKRKREVDVWLERVKSLEKEVDELGSAAESQGLIKRFFDGGKASQLNAKVEKLVQQRLDFGEPVLDVRGTRGETLQTNNIVGVVAFNEKLDKVFKTLENREVSTIGVYGMGGVGKTTLAKHIHNRLRQEYEGLVIWVAVSHEFTINGLQDKIARYLVDVDLSDEDDKDIRAARLRRALSEMESILIFDDVWDYINMAEVGCPISVERCRLIITTRSLDVCNQILCQEIVSVEKLHEDDAWQLFNETLKNEIELASQVQEVAKSMAKLCNGLPLGINTLAASMRGEKSIKAWKNAFAELKRCLAGKDGMEYEKVFGVLKYSFDRLNKNRQSERNVYNEFQLGFLYCSLYPEDYEIPIEEFARKFISEGQVDQRESRREQVEQGHFILNKLVKVCLLEKCIGYDDGDSYKCVKLHDLVRGMALKVSRGKYMVRAGDESLIEIADVEEWTNLEKVSLMKSGIKRFRDGTSPNCPMLSTLILYGNPLKAIPPSFFSKMKRLCTLDLCETLIKILPDSLCDMIHLKALLLEDCEKLASLPYLGKLKALRELNLSGTAIKDVPQGLEELLNLMFLSLDAPGLKMLPRGLLRKLGQLQHVSVPLHIQVSIEDIEDLTHLDEFCGGVKDVDDFNCFIESRRRDTCYRIGVRSHGSDRSRIGGSFGCYNNELMLSECNFQDAKVSGQGISYLTIRKCEGLSTCFMDDFSRLDNPRSLTKLRIESCGGTECILSREQGLPSQISSLEYVELVELEDLEELIQRRDIGASAGHAVAVFSCLKKLVIDYCNKLRKVGFPVSGAPNLEYIDIGRCREIEEIFEDEEGRASATLPNLKELRLYDLPRLEKVCNAPIICKSISEIFIVKCPRLTNNLPLLLDDPLPPTLGLGAIKVEREWWESLEWDFNSNLPRLLHPFLYLY